MHGSNRGLNGWTQSAAGRLGVGLIAVVLSAGAGTGTEPAADDVPPVQQDVTWPAALDDVTPRPVVSRPEAAAKRGAAHAQRDPALLPAAYQPPPPPRPGVVAEPLGTNDDDAPKKRPPIKIGVSGLVAMHTDDLDIRQALEVLSRQATLNILVSPGVQGRITVNMDGVTVDQALEAILRLGNLSSSREGNLIYVFAPEEILTQSDRGQFVTRVYHLNYIRAHDLEQMLTPFISDAGKLTVTPPSTEGIAGSTNLLGGFGAFGGAGGSSGGGGGGGSGGGGGGSSGGGAGGGGRGGGGGGGGGSVTGGNSLAGSDVVIVQDFEYNMRNIDEIVKKLDIQPLQVMVEAVIMSIEIDRNTNLGINFAILNNRGGTGIAVLGDGLSLDANAGFKPASFKNNLTGKLNGTSGSGLLADQNSLTYGFINNTTTGFIQALESVGTINVLASPRILVLNKQRAEIQLGQRLGYFTSTQNLTSTVQQVQFLNTGTLLRFRPYISNDGMIRMEVHPEKSTGSVTNNTPNSNTSEVTTNVMVPNGATMVIGGLLENDDTASQQGTLGLNRLPVVGPLFRAKTQATTKRELLIMLTPRIWKPEGLIGTPLGTGANCAPGMIGLASPTPPVVNAPLSLTGTAAVHGTATTAATATAAAAATTAAATTAAAAMVKQPSTTTPPATTNTRNLGNRTTARPVAPGPTPGPAPALLPPPQVSKPRPTFPTPPLIRAASTNASGRDVMHYDNDVRRSSAEVVANAAAARLPDPPVDTDEDPGYPRHVVRRGESLRSIAERYYGSPRFTRALEAANRRELPDPERLKPGDTVTVPPLEDLDEALVAAPTKERDGVPPRRKWQAAKSNRPVSEMP